MNKGEISELLIKLRLLQIRDSNSDINNPIGNITSVGFDNIEYPNLPVQLISTDFNSKEDSFLIRLGTTLNINKAPTLSKSDIYINGEGYSLKYLGAAPPALVNHTARPGFETACKYMEVDIRELDALINTYWNLRENGIIKEDVKNSSQSSPFKDAFKILNPILQYFLFKGTGKGMSKHSAQYILSFSNPLNENTWELSTQQQAVRKIWDKLIFSLRSKKGMPTDYPNNRDKSRNESISLWTRYSCDAYRGALHIRESR